MNGENQQLPTRAQAPEPESQWHYAPSNNTAPAAPYQPQTSLMGTPADTHPQQFARPPAELEWTASEFIAHSKGLGWYAAYVGASLVVFVLMYILTREIIPVILVGILSVIVAISASRPPRVLPYRITAGGIEIGAHFFPFNNYKSFSVVDEGAFSSIVFWPLQRFGFPVGIYYDPQHEQAIIETLADHLPLQEHHIDLVESLMRKIRF